MQVHDLDPTVTTSPVIEELAGIAVPTALRTRAHAAVEQLESLYRLSVDLCRNSVELLRELDAATRPVEELLDGTVRDHYGDELESWKLLSMLSGRAQLSSALAQLTELFQEAERENMLDGALSRPADADVHATTDGDES